MHASAALVSQFNIHSFYLDFGLSIQYLHLLPNNLMAFIYTPTTTSSIITPSSHHHPTLPHFTLIPCILHSALTKLKYVGESLS